MIDDPNMHAYDDQYDRGGTDDETRGAGLPGLPGSRRHRSDGPVRPVQQQQQTAERRLDGWVKWSGGEQPVADDEMVEVRFRNGMYFAAGDEGIAAGDWRWGHSGTDYDIVEYRVIK